MQAWTDLLDAIERGVVACERRYFDGDDVEIPAPPTIPPDLGPLPRSLETRAHAVLDRLRAAESKLARIPRPGVVPRRARFATATDDAATFDHRM
jgi:hypothetical protein